MTSVEFCYDVPSSLYLSCRLRCPHLNEGWMAL